ncbi:uncharacterized protein FFNC_15637 [Fusarium fujikuroi]|nr:uncharacterized protein FFNC_15637 [Fusarium fujikuroi]
MTGVMSTYVVRILEITCGNSIAPERKAIHKASDYQMITQSYDGLDRSLFPDRERPDVERWILWLAGPSSLISVPLDLEADYGAFPR